MDGAGTSNAAGYVNGDSHGHDQQEQEQMPADPSRIIELPLQTGELLEINLDELRDDEEAIGEVSQMFQEERMSVVYWIKMLNEYYRRGSYDTADKLGEIGVQAFRERGDMQSCVPLWCMMASYAMMHSRTSAKTVLPQPRQYHVKGKPKVEWFQRATSLVTQAEQVDPRNGYVLDTKANLYLLTGKIDEAFRTYEFILGQNASHLFALMGKARILYVRRQFKPALKLYQSVLSADPKFLPDPRIGIGLCFWNLGEHALARRAWERSRVVNPGKQSGGSSLLLGLSWINVAREARLGEEEKAEAYGRGIRYVQDAWTHDKSCAATAAALSGYFLTLNNKLDTVIKLAELALQHGDARAIVSEGHLAIARALHAQDKPDEATRHYLLSMEANPDQIQAALGVGQMYVRKKDYPAAVNTYENVLRKNPRSIEALVSLASIHARSGLAASASSSLSSATTSTTNGEAQTDKSKARELYDQVVRLFQGTADLKDGLGDKGYLDPLGARVQQIATDPNLYVEIARLWTGDDLNKSLNAYRQSLAVRRDQEEGSASTGISTKLQEVDLLSSMPPQLLCNIGSLEFSRGELESAQSRFEEAITLDLERQQRIEAETAAGKRSSSVEDDAVMMSVMYNLGIVMEARGQKEDAVLLYEQRLLARHPEFLEAKARLAALALADKQHERCSDYLKAALTAQPGHLDIRALYTYFLVEVGNPAAAKDFAVMTLKDFNKTDTYSLCAMAHLLYQQARESRDQKPEAVKDRLSRYFRACEAFDRVLQLDPNNAYAAQGLAIALAEGNLGSKGAIGPNGQVVASSNEAMQRQKNIRDALNVLTKVRESVNDGNVYVNIGLCHFAREEFERAIESFDTANNRFFDNKHLPTLLYSARARFHKANKDQSFSVLQASLRDAQAALQLAPKDEAIVYNIALIQQKGLELLQSLPASKRRVVEIQKALADAEAAAETFAALAASTAQNLAYNVDLADQRKRYGDSLIKRAGQTITEQEEWEHSEQNKIEMARRDREAERARQADIERRRREDARRQAEELAAQRKQMMEDAKLWYQKPVSESEDEEEKKQRGKGRKKKAGEEGIVEDGEGEEQIKPKKRKKAAAGEGGKKAAGGRKKSKKGDAADGKDGDAEGNQSDAAEDGDEENAPKRPSKKRKAFRTKEIISDSDVSD